MNTEISFLLFFFVKSNFYIQTISENFSFKTKIAEIAKIETFVKNRRYFAIKGASARDFGGRGARPVRLVGGALPLSHLRRGRGNPRGRLRQPHLSVSGNNLL